MIAEKESDGSAAADVRSLDGPVVQAPKDEICDTDEIRDATSIAQNRLSQCVETLTERFGAISILHWRLQTDNTTAARTIVGGGPGDIQPALQRLFTEAIDQQQLVSSHTMVTGKLCTLVAVPMELDSRDAITVVFPGQDASEPRKLQCELLASLLTVEELRGQMANDQARAKPQEAKKDASQTRRNCFGIGGWSWQHKLAAATALVVLIGICPWKHSIKGSVVCEPEVRRYVSAPFDATISQGLVKPGDQVHQGQVMALLDGSDLRSQIAGLQAKYQQALQRNSAALSSVDAGKVAMERLEIQHLASEIHLLQERQNRLEIRSPIDGVVISGDLERASGSTISVGDTIFEVAALESMVAEIAIPEANISFVHDDQPVSVRIDAVPGGYTNTRVDRLHPRSEIIANQSVFIGEAHLPNPDGSLRPGMKGTAAVDAGFRTVGWLLFNKPYQAFRSMVGW